MQGYRSVCVSPRQADLSWGAAAMPGEPWLSGAHGGEPWLGGLSVGPLVLWGTWWGTLALWGSPVGDPGSAETGDLSFRYRYSPLPRCTVLSLPLLGCIIFYAVVLPGQALKLPTLGFRSKCGSCSCQSTRQTYLPGWFSLLHEFLCG